MSSNLLLYVSRIVVLLIAIPVHECAHAWVSYRLGDPTAKAMGRLTLNPIRHFDPIGGLCLLLTGIGWAKPVPIDVRYYEDRKKGMALSALAGPVSNILMAFLALIIMKIVRAAYLGGSPTMFLYYTYVVFSYIVLINIHLGVFNLIPIPPFDGSRIFLQFLPEKIYFGIMKYERYIFIGLFLLLYLGVLSVPLSYAYNFVYGILDVLTGFVDRLAVLL